MGQAHHQVDLVLDQEDGPPSPLMDLLDEADQARDLLESHPGRRLVQQHELRLLSQEHRDLQPSPMSVGENTSREISQLRHADLVQHRPGPIQIPMEPAGRDPEAEVIGPQGLGGQSHVLQDAQVREDMNKLIGAADPQMRPTVRREIRDVLAPVEDTAGAGTQCASDQVEERGLAGSVRPDEGMDGARLYPQIHPIHRPQPSEILCQFPGLQKNLPWHPSPPWTLAGRLRLPDPPFAFILEKGSPR
jgi:hypothetical protein